MKFSGGSAPLENISNKQIVAVNKFLLSDKFDGEGAKELLQWARTSKESKADKALERDFIEKVKAAKKKSCI